jgi:ubiquinone/menaquinone biosynthesis C-methylase UbiE
MITCEKAHHYSNTVLRLIEKMPDTIWLLDAGGGPRKISLTNYVNVDIQKNKGMTNVVCDLHCLPLKDDSFDLVINEAVLEHVKKPWVVVNEIQRVLRHGGYLYVKVAFMQPVHNYPTHYFNMTKEGLLSLFDDIAGFRILKSGVEEDQMPSYTLMFVLSSYLRSLFPKTGQKMRDVEVFEDRVYGGEGLLTKILVRLYLSVSNLLKVLDRRIDKEHAEKLAAGFFLLGIKD